MKLRSTHLAVLVLVFIFGGVAVTSVTGSWRTDNSKVAAVIKTGEFAGQANPADIKGSYSLADVNTNFQVPVNDVVKAFALETVDQATFKVKDLETRYEALAKANKAVGTSSMRMFVAYYLGLPYTPTEDTWLLTPAVDMLKARGKMTPEQAKYVEAHAVAVPK